MPSPYLGTITLGKIILIKKEFKYLGIFKFEEK
jgi:hypothetical protein